MSIAGDSKVYFVICASCLKASTATTPDPAMISCPHCRQITRGFPSSFTFFPDEIEDPDEFLWCNNCCSSQPISDYKGQPILCPMCRNAVLRKAYRPKSPIKKFLKGLFG